MDEKTIQVTAILEERVVGKLKSVGVADDRSLSWLIAQACREFIAKPENVAKWKQHANAQVDLVSQIARSSKDAAKHK
jgi:hypothetical protein